MPTNKERSEAAVLAVEIVAKANGGQNESAATKCVDLLANLMHYADAHGFTFNLHVTRTHYFVARDSSIEEATHAR